MSVTTPKSLPMSRLSLSVMSNLSLVVGDAVLEPGVVDADPCAVPGEIEVEGRPPSRKLRAPPMNRSPLNWAEAPAFDEAEPSRADLELPAELRGCIARRAA
jgi:hypothetical protein